MPVGVRSKRSVSSSSAGFAPAVAARSTLLPVLMMLLTVIFSLLSSTAAANAAPVESGSWADAAAPLSADAPSWSLMARHAADVLSQVGDGEPRPQDATGDGTLPYRLLAISMAGLAGLLGVLTFWYWKATMPPARRGYLPSSDDRRRRGGRMPVDRVMEVDVARVSRPDAAIDEGSERDAETTG